ncbi:SnoaL-like domain-containing protein [Frankia sp. AiPs1]|uniref:nuclear transport factor 2 family protein n=1 Tax=Frankia sp. AiPa1 TaxID=573492 RepID=UPI00202B1C97|nr:nuclear transport factor 2 family protein [Frankia sp. AiPa1]MCL9760038.1 nuclear transport factor 2 family protein [Frankia sp. AiPa1]
MSTEYADAAARIRDTIATYAQAVDDGRTEDIVATFLPDGWASFPGADIARGHDGIRATYAALPPGRAQRHLVGNTLITEFDGDAATATSDLVFLTRGKEGHWAVRIVGRYTDHLRRSGNAWLFASRELVFI